MYPYRSETRRLKDNSLTIVFNGEKSSIDDYIYYSRKINRAMMKGRLKVGYTVISNGVAKINFYIN